MTNKESVGKFVIVKCLQFSDFMKNEKGEINVYDSVDYDISISLWNYCFVKCYLDRGLKEYKEATIKATIKAIIKANDI